MIKQYILVFVQFAGIFYFAIVGGVFPQSIWVLLVQMLAVIIGVWAVYAMKLHTLTVLPSVKAGGKLCTSGPYRYVRHPMYTAVLLFLLAMLINNYSHASLVVFLIVLVDLIIKIKVEEKILLKHYADYKDYKQKSWGIIPFVY